jgi:hypothetical protein
VRYSSHRPIFSPRISRGGRIAAAGNPQGVPNPDPPDPPDPPDEPDPPAGDFTCGTTKPVAANTGIAESIVDLEPGTLNGSGVAIYTVSSADQIFNNVRFECAVVLAAANPQFNHCEFVGGLTPGTSDRALVTAHSAAATASYFNYCTAKPEHPSKYWSNCFHGHRLRLLRCDLSGTEDCIAMYSPVFSESNNIIHCSYLHDIVFWQPDSIGRPEGSHNDLIQHHTASGHRGNEVFGCNLDGSIDTSLGDWGPGNPNYPQNIALSCMMFSPKGTGTQITGSYTYNWLSNARIGMVFERWGGSNHVLEVDFNRFYDDTFFTPGDNLGITKGVDFHLTGASSMTGNVNIDSLAVETPFTAGAYAGTWP